MEIVAVLKQEEAKLEKQLAGIRKAISALNGWHHVSGRTNGRGQERRKMPAAVRAKISRAAKQRWAKIKAKSNKG